MKNFIQKAQKIAVAVLGNDEQAVKIASHIPKYAQLAIDRLH
jgi:hypothetical protein